MDKNEILEKSRRENENQDEMEKTIQTEGESFSLTITLMVGLILYVYNMFHGLPSDTIFIMFWTSFTSSRLYRLTKRKSISDLVMMLISLALLTFYMVKYVTQG